MSTLPAAAHGRPALAASAPEPGSRRAEIALVAAEEFTRRGYHSTRVEHIADRLDVTPGALYRHVPGKYEMFRDAVLSLVAELVVVTGSDPVGLDTLVAETTRATLTHRHRGALYRWHGRYLTPGDRALVGAAFEEIRARFADAVRARRAERGAAPGGSGAVAGAILAAIASLGDHRVEVDDDDAVTLLTAIAHDLADSAPSPSGARVPPAVVSAVGVPAVVSAGGPLPRLRGGAATREAALSAAIARFHTSGYDDVTMEAIGADAGVNTSALYRHFPGKSALLAAAVDRTASVIERILDEHDALHAPGDDPAGALDDLLAAYVTVALSHGPELLLYHSELGTLAREDRQRLRRSQRAQLDRWVGLLRAAAPGTSDATARIRVHAALAIVLDGGRMVGYHPAAASRFGALARVPLLPTPDR